MSQVVGIRRALSGDADLLAELQYTAQTSQDSAWDDVSPWAIWLADSRFFAYVAEQSDLLGVVAVGSVRDADLMEEDFLDSNPGEIIAWFMHPDQSHQKLGRKLLVHGLTVLKRCFYESAVIWVPSRADRAQGVVRSLRFGDTGLQRIRNFRSKSIDENCYKLDLGGYF